MDAAAARVAFGTAATSVAVNTEPAAPVIAVPFASAPCTRREERERTGRCGDDRRGRGTRVGHFRSSFVVFLACGARRTEGACRDAERTSRRRGKREEAKSESRSRRASNFENVLLSTDESRVSSRSYRRAVRCITPTELDYKQRTSSPCSLVLARDPL